MSPKYTFDPITPDLEIATQKIKQIHRKRGDQDIIFTVARGTRSIDSNLYREFCNEMHYHISKIGTRPVHGHDKDKLSLEFYEVRLLIANPHSPEAGLDIAGDGPALYIFSHFPEPDMKKDREKVWKFLRKVQQYLNHELLAWVSGKVHNKASPMVRHNLDNMAIFVMFSDGFMGGWSFCISEGSYENLDPGKSTQPVIIPITRNLTEAMEDW